MACAFSPLSGGLRSSILKLSRDFCRTHSTKSMELKSVHCRRQTLNITDRNEGLARVRVIAAPVRLWAMHCRLHLLQGHQTLAQGPTRRQHGRLAREGGASIRLLGRRWQVLGTDPVAAWRSDASWAPAPGAA